METTIPVSISVLGHPFVETATIAWSATAGMIPQALLFTSKGGEAEATLTSQNPQLESIQYHAQIAFARYQSNRSWHIEVNRVIPISAGGDAIEIDLSSWVHHLVLKFQGDIQSCDRGEANANAPNIDHLVVNLVWKGTHLSAPVKCSQRMTPNTSWDVLYICPADNQISASLSAFGVIDRQLIQLSAQSIDPAQSPLSLSVRHSKIQLMAGFG